jgi:hypothetical protein
MAIAERTQTPLTDEEKAKARVLVHTLPDGIDRIQGVMEIEVFVGIGRLLKPLIPYRTHRHRRI